MYKCLSFIPPPFPLYFTCGEKNKSWKKKTWKLSSWKNLLAWKKKKKSPKKKKRKKENPVKKKKSKKKKNIFLRKFNLKKKNILLKKIFTHKVFSPWTLFFSLGTQIRWFTIYAAKNKVISNNHNKVITTDIQILILHARLPPLHTAEPWQSCRWGQVPSTSPFFPKNPPEATTAAESSACHSRCNSVEEQTCEWQLYLQTKKRRFEREEEKNLPLISSVIITAVISPARINRGTKQSHRSASPCFPLCF